MEKTQRRPGRRVRVPRRGVLGTGGTLATGGALATGGTSGAGAGAGAGVPRIGLPQLGQLPASSSVSPLPQLGQYLLFMATSPQLSRLKYDAPLSSGVTRQLPIIGKKRGSGSGRSSVLDRGHANFLARIIHERSGGLRFACVEADEDPSKAANSQHIDSDHSKPRSPYSSTKLGFVNNPG